MKELLRQLTTFAPALIAQMKGDPVALEEFTKGYQQTLAQQQAQQMRQQTMTQQGEDRQRQITRQGEQDRIAGEERDYRKSQDAIEMLSKFVPAQETMGGAESISQSIMARVPEHLREGLAGVADQQLREQPQMITDRQRLQAEAFLDKWEKSPRKPAFDSAELTAEQIMIDLPEHLAGYLQKPQASLAEVQRFARLPVGKPAGRPADTPSLQSKEVMVGGKLVLANYNPKTGTYTDQGGQPVTVDAVPPRPPAGAGGVDSRAMARFNSIASAYDRSPLIRAADRTLILDDAAQNIRKDPNNAAAQMALAYGFIQALDTYQSAVREGELGNLGSLGTVWQQLGVSANKLITTGAFMPPDVALQIANSADQMVQVIEKGRNQKMAEFASRAKVNKVEDMWNEFVAGMPARAQAGGATAPMQKAIPGIRGGVAESNDGGKTWKRVK